jgi:hypothetical protein
LKRMHERGIQIVASVLFMLFGLLGVPLASSAATTPDTCDTTPKYWCVHINYDPGSGTATVYNRWYEGAIDGGAKEWRREWTTDYHWDGSIWATVRSWGYGTTYADAFLGHWEALESGTIDQPASVMVRLQYHEYIGYWYYWCSNQNEHHLEDNTSLVWGNSTC